MSRGKIVLQSVRGLCVGDMLFNKTMCRCEATNRLSQVSKLPAGSTSRAEWVKAMTKNGLWTEVKPPKIVSATTPTTTPIPLLPSNETEGGIKTGNLRCSVGDKVSAQWCQYVTGGEQGDSLALSTQEL